MDAAVATGEVDVTAGYTSDGLIAKYHLVALDDPRHAIPPYDAIVLLAPKRADDQARCGGRSGRCWGRSTLRSCARPICARQAATGRVRRMRWRGGCGSARCLKAPGSLVGGSGPGPSRYSRIFRVGVRIVGVIESKIL
jgi:hypothetical protein